LEFNSPPTEIILTPSSTTLGRLYLDWNPQPGSYLEVAGQTYLVLERKHQYFLRSGRYHLRQVVLYVQKSLVPGEQSLCNGQWVIGNATCRYNARSQVLRCAVNPNGPCDRCFHYRT
jgi:hypothetical protein